MNSLMATVTVTCDDCDEVIIDGVSAYYDFAKVIDSHDEVCDAYEDEEDDEDED